MLAADQLIQLMIADPEERREIFLSAGLRFQLYDQPVEHGDHKILWRLVKS